MPDINFPTVNLTINDVSFSDIPPEYIREFTFTDKMAGGYDIDMLLHDVEYTRLEDVLFDFNPTDKFNLLVASFGYLIEGQPITSATLRCALEHYKPTFRAGLDARIRGYAIGGALNTQINPQRSFVDTPYHRVVERCAKDLFGENVDLSWIQKTKVDSPLYTGSVRPYGSYTNFIRQEIAPYAEDPDGKTGFMVNYGPNGDTIRFGTREWLYQKRVDELGGVPTFTWLRGEADSDVISFEPDFQSDILGGFGQAGLTAVGWDAISKRPLTIPVNPTSANAKGRMSKYLGKGVATVSLGKDETSARFESRGAELRRRILGQAIDTGSAALFDLFFGDAKTIDLTEEEAAPRTAQISLSKIDLVLAEAAAYGRWKTLAQTAVQATLELNGSERTVGLRAGDLIRVIVIIPRTGAIHWSSGLYMIEEVLHEITTNYRVVCHLYRDAHARGVEDVPGGVKFFDEIGGLVEDDSGLA